VPRDEWNDGASIVDPKGKGPRIWFQRMDTAKPGKNRLHLDVRVGCGPKDSVARRRARIDPEVSRLEAMGATKLRKLESPGYYAVTMQDPEGNEFCLC
jgi:glyoxalase superfamily protein